MTSLLTVCTSLSTGNSDPLQDLHSVISVLVLVGQYISLTSVFNFLCLVLFFLADSRVGLDVVKYEFLKSPSVSPFDLHSMFAIIGQSLREIPREPTTLSLSLFLTSGIHWLSVCCDILDEVARSLAVYVVGGRVAGRSCSAYRGTPISWTPPSVAALPGSTVDTHHTSAFGGFLRLPKCVECDCGPNR